MVVGNIDEALHRMSGIQKKSNTKKSSTSNDNEIDELESLERELEELK